MVFTNRYIKYPKFVTKIENASLKYLKLYRMWDVNKCECRDGLVKSYILRCHCLMTQITLKLSS